MVGGVFALLTARIVARSAKRRDERASAMIVTATLAAVRVASETLAALSAQEGVTEENLPLRANNDLGFLCLEFNVILYSGLIKQWFWYAN
jgi:hypothetical protein